MMRNLFTFLLVSLVPAITMAQVAAPGTQHTQTKEAATQAATEASAPQAATQPQLQPQQLNTLSQTIEQTDAIQDIEKRLQALEEEQAATAPQTDITTTDRQLSQPSELLENLPLWLNRAWQWGLIWGFLWWIPWFVFSWQWWRRRFWVFAWPWPWWWWLPWLWFIPWLIWGWWWGFCWWFWWCWLWWWIPWIFWLPWWLIVIKHVLQWLRRQGPPTMTTP